MTGNKTQYCLIFSITGLPTLRYNGIHQLITNFNVFDRPNSSKSLKF